MSCASVAGSFLTSKRTFSRISIAFLINSSCLSVILLSTFNESCGFSGSRSNVASSANRTNERIKGSRRYKIVDVNSNFSWKNLLGSQSFTGCPKAWPKRHVQVEVRFVYFTVVRCLNKNLKASTCDAQKCDHRAAVAPLFRVKKIGSLTLTSKSFVRVHAIAVGIASTQARMVRLVRIYVKNTPIRSSSGICCISSCWIKFSS